MTTRISSLTELRPVREYLERIGAKERSFKSAVIQEQNGKYTKDIQVINFGNDGTVATKDEAYLPTELEQEKIKLAFKEVKFPEPKIIPKSALTLPDDLKQVDSKNIFIFLNEKNEILMIQQRVDFEDGNKAYLPWTFFDDEIWRRTEPGGKLPLWGLDGLKDHTVAFLHEGVKPAKAMREMTEASTWEMKDKLNKLPWGKELSAACHLGWIGGAFSPHRTDWSVLKSLKRIYIVSDADPEGRDAVPKIAKHLYVPTFHIQVNQEFPMAWDLADPFPQKMFKKINDQDHYIGPSFDDCVHPATYMTTQLKQEEGKKGRPPLVLRPHAKSLWAYVGDVDSFVCVEFPKLKFESRRFDKEVAPFSDSDQTSKLVMREYQQGKTYGLCYRPDRTERIITEDGKPSINLHTPSNIKRKSGDPKPFLDFLEYMFINDEERKAVESWCATIIARPDNRIEYGLLLVSEATGIGKTTLGQNILAPLVGMHNVSFPDEAQITGEFTEWVANKRLAIVNEIYAGHSWKTYHRVKSFITDKSVSVNIKYERQYTVQNWVHIIACSNSLQALKMDQDDRRWFYPEITEERWSKDRFKEFHNWLESGGLGIIKHWAENYPPDQYLERGDRAPDTARKKQLVEDSMSEAQKEALVIAERLASAPKPAALTMKQISKMVRDSVQGKVFDSDLELRKAMKKEEGITVWDERIKIDGFKQFVILNKSLNEQLKSFTGDLNERIREAIKETNLETTL